MYTQKIQEAKKSLNHQGNHTSQEQGLRTGQHNWKKKIGVLQKYREQRHQIGIYDIINSNQQSKINEYILEVNSLGWTIRGNHRIKYKIYGQSKVNVKKKQEIMIVSFYPRAFCGPDISIQIMIFLPIQFVNFYHNMGQTFSFQKSSTIQKFHNNSRTNNKAQSSSLKIANNSKSNKFRVRMHQASLHLECQISRQCYHDIEALTNMYNKFTQKPYDYICMVFLDNGRVSQSSFTTQNSSNPFSVKQRQIENKISFCGTQSLCSSGVLIHTRKIQMTLDNLFVIKRRSKMAFLQSQIWYSLKYISEIFCFLQNNNMVYGSISPSSFSLHSKCKQLRINVKDLRPDNQHFFQYKLTNYYSPEFINSLTKADKQTIKGLNMFKCQVFAIGLMILQMVTIPQQKPKMYLSVSKQFNYPVINTILASIKMNYSWQLYLILTKMLCVDLRNRPDWIFMKQWIFRHEDRRYQVAPCFYGDY